MSLPTAHFDRLYAEQDDPYGFTDRWYEQRKYAVTLAALPERRYRSAYEPGCSIGVLTAQLAARCDHLLASDGSAAAVERARRRVADQPQVDVQQLLLPGQWPEGVFDLVLVSELAYYLDEPDLDRFVACATGAVGDGGTLVAVHWRHPAPEHPCTGDEVQDRIGAAAVAAGLVETVDHIEADFRLGVWVRVHVGESPDHVSVAARDGVL